MDGKAVGRRIKEAREKRHLTQEELAARIDISPTHVSVIERGTKIPRLDTFVAIANALEVSGTLCCWTWWTTRQRAGLRPVRRLGRPTLGREAANPESGAHPDGGITKGRAEGASFFFPMGQASCDFDKSSPLYLRYRTKKYSEGGKG